MSQKLGIHEMLDAREILSFKNLALTKSTTMSGLVKCEELKAILKNDVEKGKQHIQQLQALLMNEGEKA